MAVWDGSCHTPGRSPGGPSNTIAAAHEQEPGDDVLDRAELVRDVENRDSELARSSSSRTPSDSCDSASTPVVGSSRARSAGSDASALAINARCCMPPESVLQRRVGARGEPDGLDRARDGRAVGAAQRAPVPAGASRPAETTSRTVTGASPTGGALGQVADPRRRRDLPGRRPKTRDAARLGSLEPEHQPQQRRLAAAVRPGDADELAGAELERDVLEHAAGPPGRRTRRRRARRPGSRPASERLPQCREIRPHDGEVVVAARRSASSVSPSSGLSTAVSTPASRATVSASFGETSVSKNTVVAPAALHDVDERREAARRGLGLGREPVERNLLEAVARGEVAEGGMARDDLAALAVARGRCRNSPSSALEPARRADRAAALRIERRRRSPRDRRVPHRVEPDVRIEGGPPPFPSAGGAAASRSTERPCARSRPSRAPA